MAKNGASKKPHHENGDRTSSTPQPADSSVQLFSNEPNATKEAMRTFHNLKESIYIDKIKHVYSASNEFMTCECSEELDKYGENLSCGPDSDCINRLTNIECVDDQCGCGYNCQNQRFQNNDIADVSIFKTDHKGYGMRANVDILEHTFIVEYKGEVVDKEEYNKRKDKYSAEGIKHFYFMMIQDNEIIDATKKASIGRFCNHSCDPNAYIEKWVVNKRFRMGIFAKRKVLKGEEITFDYNVDRYGAEPQKCYCGAANCLGVMGGKTQSENARLLPHAITEALGVKSADEKRWIKEQRKSGIKVTQDNIDSNVNVEFVKSLEISPLELDDIPKVSSCLLQPSLDLIVIEKVLERFSLEDEYNQQVINVFNRLHGLQALGNCLKTAISSLTFPGEIPEMELKIIVQVVDLLLRWPELTSRNSVQSSNLDSNLKIILPNMADPDFAGAIEEILDKWKDLKVIYRIPKKVSSTSATSNPVSLYERRSKKEETPAIKPVQVPWAHLNLDEIPEKKKVDGIPLPPGWEWAQDEKTGKKYFFDRDANKTQWDQPQWLPAAPRTTLPEPPISIAKTVIMDEEEKRRMREREREEKAKVLRELERERQKAREREMQMQESRAEQLNSIINQASQEITKNGSKSKANGKSPTNNHHDQDSDSVSRRNKKQYTKLFAAVVPNAIKRYEPEIGREKLKAMAKEITEVLTEKELRYHVGKAAPKEFTSEKNKKVKKFADDYMRKYLERKKGKDSADHRHHRREHREHGSSHHYEATDRKRQRV